MSQCSHRYGHPSDGLHHCLRTYTVPPCFNFAQRERMDSHPAATMGIILTLNEKDLDLEIKGSTVEIERTLQAAEE